MVRNVQAGVLRVHSYCVEVCAFVPAAHLRRGVAACDFFEQGVEGELHN
jgi:hypothetical protein